MMMHFEYAIKHNKFKQSSNENNKEIVIADHTDVEKLTKFVRQMRPYEGSENLKLNNVIEDPVFRNSQNSLLHQMNDVIAYCLRQRYETNNYMKKKGGHNFYFRIPDIVLKETFNTIDWGIIEV